MEPLERWEGPGRDKSDQEAIPGVAGGSGEAGERWGGGSQSRGKGGVSTAFHVAEAVLRSVHWAQRAGIVRPCWNSFHGAWGWGVQELGGLRGRQGSRAGGEPTFPQLGCKKEGGEASGGG